MVDEEMVRRLEASAASAALRTIEAMRGLDPQCAADAKRFGSGVLVAMGRSRFVNRAVGVSLDPLGPAEVAAIEAFFGDHGLASSIELSAWAPPPTVEALRDRGYAPVWFRSMHAHWLDDDVDAVGARSDSGVELEQVHDGTADAWMNVLARGNGADDAVSRATSDEFAAANRAVADSVEVLAFVDGTSVGCASVQVVDGVAWLGGAATLPRTVRLRHPSNPHELRGGPQASGGGWNWRV